jgi:hypothetical protein
MKRRFVVGLVLAAVMFVPSPAWATASAGSGPMDDLGVALVEDSLEQPARPDPRHDDYDSRCSVLVERVSSGPSCHRPDLARPPPRLATCAYDSPTNTSYPAGDDSGASRAFSGSEVRKLGVRNVTEAVRVAEERGWL